MTSKSKPSYLHKYHVKTISNGKTSETEEFIIDGSRGLSFKFFNRKDDHVVKYSGREKSDGTFDIKQRIGDKVESSVLSADDLITLFKKVKGLEFAAKYLKKRKPKGGRKRVSKKKRKSKRKSKKMRR